MNLPDQTNDDLLLKQYREQNDHMALEALLRRHADQAYHTAVRVCRNPADAEDAVQVGFVKIMKHASAYRGGGHEHSVRAWLMKTVINACKDKIRGDARRRTREEIVVAEQDEAYLPDEETRAEEDLRENVSTVLQELDALPSHYKSAIWMRFCQQMDRSEAAFALDISEKTLDNQVQYGLTKLRQRLAARGVASSLASLVAVFPHLQVEPAPHSLLSGVASAARRAWLRTLLCKAAAITTVLGCGGASIWLWKGRDEPTVPPKPAPVAPIHYDRNFNSPGVPPEFKAVLGKITHIPNGGPDRKGCLEIQGVNPSGDFGGSSQIKVDVPISRWPVVVRWKSSALYPKTGGRVGFAAQSCWFPIRDVASFGNLTKFQETLLDTHQKQSAWTEHVEYYSGTFIDRWVDGQRFDLTVGRADPSGRISLMFCADHQIDDLVISSLEFNALPDVSLYLNALKTIPAAQRVGVKEVPGVKSADPRRKVLARFAECLDHWAEPPSGSKARP